jgi:hypothetical protein
MVFDDDADLNLTTSETLLWSVLNRFWNLKTPLYTPGFELLAKKMGKSVKTVSRALKTLESPRPCRRNCGREHPLVFVKQHGMNNPSSIMPYVCDLTIAPRQRAQNSPPSKVAKEEVAGQDVLLPIESSKTDCPVQSGQTVSLVDEMTGQPVHSFKGMKIPILDTTAETTDDVVVPEEEKGRRELLQQLVAVGVFETRAATLLESHGLDVCRRQLSYLPGRLATGNRNITNTAGLLIRSITEDWEPVHSRSKNASAASPIPPGLREHIERQMISGNAPSTRWTQDAGITSSAVTAIARAVAASETAAHFPLSDALHEEHPEQYEAEMTAIYETLDRPFENIRGYRHPIYFSRCLTILEERLAKDSN